MNASQRASPSCSGRWKGQGLLAVQLLRQWHQHERHRSFKIPEHPEDDYIVFERAKTLLSTRSHPRPISIYFTEDMRRGIDRWGNKPALPDTYIFPIIQSGDDAVRQGKSIQQFIHVINTWMKRISAPMHN